MQDDWVAFTDHWLAFTNQTLISSEYLVCRCHDPACPPWHHKTPFFELLALALKLFHVHVNQARASSTCWILGLKVHGLHASCFLRPEQACSHHCVLHRSVDIDRSRSPWSCRWHCNLYWRWRHVPIETKSTAYALRLTTSLDSMSNVIYISTFCTLALASTSIKYLIFTLYAYK